MVKYKINYILVNSKTKNRKKNNSKYTKGYHVCQREFYMLNIKLYSILSFECL